ncbi:hypothetical protein D9615_007750 [Tricholomella constricta]|uniref:RING-type domain-containing protein n=1 Tax=Tricholomella constricta TaxID=117010 RepID=A0A8H5H3N7_9AGAR|nr:hypothetical protein D9615_007750 [Tricholomella constricta]
MMAKLRSQAPIEISSSPEPELNSKHRRAQRTKPSANVPVIELTDSDSDDGALSARVLPELSINAIAGPSARSVPTTQLQPKVGGASSIENISTPQRNVKAASRHAPLFLPSDEENTPPQKSKRAPSPTPLMAVVGSHSPARINVDLEVQENVPAPAARDSTQPEELELEQAPEPDPQSSAMARILEIIPDIEPDYLLALVAKYMLEHPEQGLDIVVETILHTLFDDAKYPKIDRMGKGKRKQTDAEADEAQATGSPAKKSKIDYADKNRPFKGGVHYADLALEQLQTAFPFIPKAYLRGVFMRNEGLYAPTHLFLLEQDKTHQRQREAKEKVTLPYNRRVTPFRPKGKGVEKADDELEAECKWLADHLTGQGDDGTATSIDDAANDADDEDCVNGIECGCCFSKCPFDKMVQCPETHLFCAPCMTSYASTLLGTHDPNIKCMDQSGCTVLIPASELKRFLPEKLMALWERVKQRKEVEAAGLEGLEECPFCEWGCVIENPDEKLLRCGNMEGCGAVSCRGCKKLDHLPKSCKEMEEDKHLDGRHAVEEAMTQALMRNCPKCQKSFIKESGCNKMTCPNCQTLSCYVCRQVIKGYDHFNPLQAGQAGRSNDPNAGKCLLWDSVEHRHVQEVVNAAAERALEEYKRTNPDVEDKDIKVDLPVAPPDPHATHRQQMQRNAQAALDRAVADHERLRAMEEPHRVLMRDREADIRLLNETSMRMPQLAYDYADRARELSAALGHDQARWYQMRLELQQAQVRVGQARAQVAAYQAQAAIAPAWNYNLNVNMYANLPPPPPPVLPRVPAVPRRARPRAKRRR